MNDEPALAETYCDLRVSLVERFERLADRARFADLSSAGLNDEIAAFVVKYASDYFRGGSIELLRQFRDCIESDDESACDHVLDRLGRDAGDEHHGMAVACLLDVHGTAAFVREVAFAAAQGPPRAREVSGVDLGSGTGILTAAIAMAAARENVAATIYGFDRHSALVRRSGEVLAMLKDVLGRREISVVMETGDLTSDAPYLRAAWTHRWKAHSLPARPVRALLGEERRRGG